MSYIDRYCMKTRFPERQSDEICLTAYVALFIASKNSEVEPLSVHDVRNHFLNGTY